MRTEERDEEEEEERNNIQMIACIYLSVYLYPQVKIALSFYCKICATMRIIQLIREQIVANNRGRYMTETVMMILIHQALFVRYRSIIKYSNLAVD
jgi:hypothetical protein